MRATTLRAFASRASRTPTPPADPQNSALAVDFNTINAVRNGDEVRSAEKQTPITPLAIKEFRQRGPNGTGRISLSQNRTASLQYAASSFADSSAGSRQREGQGLDRQGSPRGTGTGLRSPAVASPVQILIELLRASNNYIANQVFMEIGGHRLGGPVSLEKSLKVSNEMLATHGLATDLHFEEGSGISRPTTRFTARGFAKVLELFAPHADLLRGHDGGRNKTGSLEGVRTLAGYANTSNHGRVRFVISLKSNDEMRFQLLKAIESGL